MLHRFSRFTWSLSFYIGAMSMGVWYGGETRAARSYRLILGIVAAVFAVLASALWLRQFRWRVLKKLPMKWLQKNHIRFAVLMVPPAILHTGGWRTPQSLLSSLLVGSGMLILITGAASSFFKGLRPTATFAEQTLNSKTNSNVDNAALSPRQKDALVGSQTIVQAQDNHLEGHRGLTLAFLLLLVMHIFTHLYY